jgi:hypothetical protein
MAGHQGRDDVDQLTSAWPWSLVQHGAPGEESHECWERPGPRCAQVARKNGGIYTTRALSERVRPVLHAAIRSAKPYVEGRPVKVIVTGKRDLVGVEELVAVKLKPQ